MAGIKPGPDGNYRFGDMILTEAQYQLRYGKQKIAFSGIKGNQYRWPNGGKLIKYKIFFRLKIY